MDDDGNPAYFEVSFSADPEKRPVMSTKPPDDISEQNEDGEHKVVDEQIPQQTPIDEDKIEKGPASSKTTVDEDKLEKNRTPKKRTADAGKDQPPKSVPIVESDASITLAELEDDDTELWLIAVPRHESVRATLPGSKFGFGTSEPPKPKKGQDAGRVGILRGSYVYQEVTSPGNKNMRAVFVIQDEKGHSRLEVAKPFARTINVSFDADMDLSNHDAPIKTYPELPEGLELQYVPIGSKKRRLE